MESTSLDPLRIAEPGGRRSMLAWLSEQFSRAEHGPGGGVYLSGNPGVGKTWLLGRLAEHAEARALTVLRGGSLEAEGMPPYLPFLEALGAYVRASKPEVLQRQLGAGAQLLAGLLPEIELKLQRLPRGPHLAPEQARLRLFDAVADFLRAIADPRPAILLLDDLHWADTATLDLLVHVARRNQSAGLLIVGAYRPGDAAVNPAFQRALAELGRLRLLIATLDIPPLSEIETRELGEGYLRGRLHDQLAADLWRHSEGNPFVAEELLHGWIDAGQVRNEAGVWALGERAPNALPKGITAAAAQRVARLDPSVVDTLRVAAVLGRTFDVGLLARVLDEDAEPVEERLLMAEERALIHSTAPGMFTFAHDTIREFLYARLPSTTRQRLHEAAGLALERGMQRSVSRQLAELAFHFAHSNDTRRALQYARQAGDRAMDDYAFDDAVDQYQLAANLADTSNPERSEILLLLGGAALAAGVAEIAESAFRDAQALFEAGGDRFRAGLAAYGLGSALWRREALAQAEQALQQAVALTSSQPSKESVRILLDLAELRGSSLYQHQSGLTVAAAAQAQAIQLGDRRLQATAGRTLGRLHVISNDLVTGLPLLETALETALTEHDLVEAAETCACLANAYHWAGLVRRSLELTDRRVKFAREAHDEYQLRHVFSWAGFMATCLADWSTADAMFDRQGPLVEHMPEPLAFLHVNRGFSIYVRGDTSTARPWLERGLSTYRGFGSSSLAWHLGLAGLCDLALGDRRAARANLDEQEKLVEALPAESFQRGCALATMARAAAELEDRTRAAAYYPQLLPFAGLYFWFQVDLSLGLLALCLDEHAAAAEHLERGRASAAEGAILPELADCLVAQAELALQRGGRGSSLAARELLGQAAAVFAQLGIGPRLNRVRALLRGLPTQPGPTGSPAPAGLTSRELAVLRSVAAGRSNRDIATALALSEKTVANHVTSILNKIGADNRAAAAAFAVRHNLG
ncbi:MAG TPA: AAA family ATPase [Chloroflexota bacterium]|nr:AAA family ATPase [Chloroflexota bacterium]